MSHNLENVTIINRHIEGLMNKLALGDMVDYSFEEAMEICHWLGRKIRPVGASWYLTTSKIDHRYAVRYDNGNEYCSRIEDIQSRWEVIS